jgi:GTP-binding protein EngB required for normal cell division
MNLISKTTADVSVTPGSVRILKVYWLNPANLADTLVLQDGSGTEIVSMRCEAVNQSQVVDFPGSGYNAVGLKLSTLTSGTAKLYIA